MWDVRHAALGAVLVLFFALVPIDARAQVQADSARAASDTTRARLVDITANRLQRETLPGGVQVETLVGAVRLVQDSTVITARRATQRSDDRIVRFDRAVRIAERGDTLTADRVRYDRRSKVGDAEGDVRITDGEVAATGPSAQYFTREKRSVFLEGVRLADSVAVLTSESGVYLSREERADFAGAVRLARRGTTVRSDSLTYFRETEISIARGAVVSDRYGGEQDDGGIDAAAPIDSTRRTLLFSAYAYTDAQAGTSQARGAPLLVQIRADTTRTDSLGQPARDTLFLAARTLDVSRSDTLQRLVAVGDVRLWEPARAARADSVVVDRFLVDGEVVREETRLFGAPAAWLEGAQVTGDTLRLVGADGRLDSLFVRGSAFIAQEDSAMGRIHQLRGRDLVGVFSESERRTFTVGPNAEVIRYLEGDADSTGAQGGGVSAGASEALEASADQLVIEVRGEAVERVVGTDGIEGTLYPIALVPQPFELVGYRWEPERRPTRESVVSAWAESLREVLAEPERVEVVEAGE